MHSVEYKLRSLLNSHTLKILEISDCTDPKKLVEFNKNYCDSRKIKSFISNIKETTEFPFCSVPLSTDSIIHTVYFCDVAIGKSLFVTPNYAENLSPSQGYNSFIIDQNKRSDYLSDSPINLETCFYVMKDSKRILPIYKIVFEYDEEFERKSKGKNICHKCIEADAIVFCPSERASFCKKCDEIVHSDSFLKRHERKYFDELGQKRFICCSTHPTKTIDYFCKECMELLCVECKITGSHSKPSTFDHPVINFLDACNLAKNTILEGSSNIENEKEKAGLQIKEFKAKSDGFRNNISNIRKEIERDFKNLIHQLDSIESEQRKNINAAYLNRMHYKTMVEKMIAYPNELDPVDQLLAFKNILEERNNETKLEVEETEMQKIEKIGRITLSSPKEDSFKKNLIKNPMDRAVTWKIETLNINEDTQ